MEISALTFFPRHVRITVYFRHHLYSSQVPDLDHNLMTMLPSLREHLCRNRNGLPFVEELGDTELGHVFEHIILALLHGRGIYARGQTTWNWQRDPIGTYRITINTGKKLVIKECLLVAQAILTNALFGPPVQFATPSPEPVSDRLRVRLKTRPAGSRLLFTTRDELIRS